MSDYTPTTETIRARIVSSNYTQGDQPDLGAAFDRWLAAHDAEVRAEVISNMDKWIDASIDARRKTPREDAE